VREHLHAAFGVAALLGVPLLVIAGPVSLLIAGLLLPLLPFLLALLVLVAFAIALFDRVRRHVGRS
jgi:hypothetical protein